MKKIFVTLMFLSLCAGLVAQTTIMKTIEFHDQNIRDILLTLGELNNVSIVPDETVTGQASYVFANMSFQQALTTFLQTYHLSATTRDGVYNVSRVNVNVNADGTVDLNAQSVPMRDILRVLSDRINKTILYDNIPNDPITINIHNASVKDILQIAIARFPTFFLDIQDKYFYLRDRSLATAENSATNTAKAITQTGDLFNFNITHGRFKDLLLSLFSMGKKEFLLLLDRDAVVDNIFLKNLSFDEALRTLLFQVNADFKIENGIYYIFEIQKQNLLKLYLTTVVVPFKYISSTEFLGLLPPGLNSGNLFRLDDKGNKIVLSGSPEEIKPIWDFIRLIDKPSSDGTTLRVDLNYVKTDDVIPILPPDLAGFNPHALPDKTSLIVTLPEGKKQEFINFIHLVDQPIMDTPIHLRFMKADDLLAKLPPSVAAANVIKTDDPTLVFFKGSKDLLQRFKKDLQVMDVPRPLLRYELLVLQFDEGKTITLTNNMTIQAGDQGQAFTGALGQLLNFNFDVVGNFGVGFGMNLNAAITDNDARVVADTTLNGLSGEKISFQNTTSTYYAANEISTTGSATVVGTVNQLSSGLILDLEGWISSDNMVTLKVNATLSKQEASSSSASSTLPPNTTEKKLSTEVRMPSGQPLVIGGLKETDKTVTLTKTPILGDLPLIGWLFQGKTDQLQHTEFTIYIVPILDQPEEQVLSPDDRMLMYYHRFEKDLR